MYSILVVDDTIENLDILSILFKDDYDVKVATNGHLAIKIAKSSPPDIILLDIMMPEMNGYEVCLNLKSDPLTKKIPIIFITAKDQDIDEVNGFALGAVDYITKPISPLVTKARVRTHLALNNQKKELEKSVKEKTKELYETRLEIIRKLSMAAEFKDYATGKHIERVSRFSYVIGKIYGLDENQCDLLMCAAPMHDIGKIGIPDYILKKPAKLTTEEFDIIKTHTEIGGTIIGTSDDELLKTAKIIALQHHEKWDGEGYPRGLKGEDISIYARITAIADVFDALTNIRPYKDAWINEKSINWIKKNANVHFDGKVVDAFLEGLPQILEIQDKYRD